MLTNRYKAGYASLTRPLAQQLVRWRIHPSAITVAGLALVAASCVWLLLTRHVVSFCIVVTIATLFDALDGAVARAAGRATAFGAYLDAMCDRYGEALVIVTVAWVTGYWLLSAIGLAGALLISYAKARAAMEVSVSNLEWPDLMERTERDVLYIVGLAASRLWPVRIGGHDLFWWTLAAFGVLTHVTVAQRMRRAGRLIRARSASKSV